MSQPFETPGSGTEIPNHLVKAVLSAAFCCLPLGVVAVIFAAQVETAITAGNIERARELSAKANLWSNLGIASFFVIMALYLIFVVVLGIGIGLSQ